MGTEGSWMEHSSSILCTTTTTTTISSSRSSCSSLLLRMLPADGSWPPREVGHLRSQSTTNPSVLIESRPVSQSLRISAHRCESATMLAATTSPDRLPTALLHDKWPGARFVSAAQPCPRVLIGVARALPESLLLVE